MTPSANHRNLSILNRKGADAFGLAVTRTIHAAPAAQQDNYGSEAGKD